MDAQAACKVVNEFIFAHLEEHHHFTPEDDRTEGARAKVLIFAGSRPVGDAVLKLGFFWGQDVDEDETDPRGKAEQVIAALREAHPELDDFKLELKVKQQY